MCQENIYICQPYQRDVKTRRVVSWIRIGAVDSIEATGAVLERLDLDGVMNAVAISNTEQIVIEGELAARFFRVYYGMQ